MGKTIAGEERPWPSPGAGPQGSGEHSAFVWDLAGIGSPSLSQPQTPALQKGCSSPLAALPQPC